MVWPGTKSFVKQLYRECDHDDLGNTAAALTYFAMLALFPFLIFLVSLMGLVLDPRVTQHLVGELGRFAPGQVTQIVNDRLVALQQSSNRRLLTVAIVGSIWAASGGVTALMQALNRCYDQVETRPFWKTRGLGILVTIAGGVVGVIAVAVVMLVPVAGHFIGGQVGAAIAWLRFPVAGAIMTALWAVLYWILPNVRPKFQLITPGSVVGVILWLAASWGFAEYVGHSRSYEATYGTLGGVVVLLVWMWISSLVILLGAEINKILTPAEKLEQAPTSEARLGRERDGERGRAPTGKPSEPEPSPA
jgi:membrane protein